MKVAVLLLCLFAVCWAAELELSLNEATILPPPTNKKLLVLLTSLDEKSSYSKYFEYLKGRGYDLTYSEVDNPELTLGEFGAYTYEGIIILAPTADEFGGNINADTILEYIDSGRSVILAGSSEASPLIRDIAAECGAVFEPEGTYIMNEDKKNIASLDDGEKNTVLTRLIPTADRRIIFPHPVTLPVAYRGTGIVIEKNERMIDMLTAAAGSYSAKPNKKASKKEVQYSLVVANHARNNARVVISGSIDMFDDDFLKTGEYDNMEFITQLTSWALRERGHLRITNVTHHIAGQEEKHMYKIKDEVEYSCIIQEYVAGTWIPFIADDIMIDFTMLYPYYRVPLRVIDNKIGRYRVSFAYPDKFGVYQYIVKYHRDGYNVLEAHTTIPVRPFRHDEHERFVPAAYPFYAGVFVTIIGFVIFSSMFVLHRTKKVTKTQ